MQKNTKTAKALTDDWIQQVVTGKRHKLAHLVNGGSIAHLVNGLAVSDLIRPQGFPDVSAGEAKAGLEPTYPATPNVVTTPIATSAPSGSAETITYDQSQALTRSHNARIATDKANAAAAAAQPKPRITTYGDNYANGGCVKKMASGGKVVGPGTGTSDSVPAMLSDGEYVLPADTVASIGKDKLDYLKSLTHTHVNKPAMKGMVMMRVNGGGDIEPFPDTEYATDPTQARTKSATDPTQAQTESDRAAIKSGAGHLAAAAADIASQPVSLAGSAYNALVARPARALGVPLPDTRFNVDNWGATPVTDWMYGADGRGPHAKAPQEPTATANTPVPPTTTTTPTPPATPAGPKAITAPDFMPTLSGPNTVQDMVSEGRGLMNTQGIGGMVQAKGLNRLAQTVAQSDAPSINGQYQLQNTAMSANERLEQAKLVEHQRQQQMETYTPIKNTTGDQVVGAFRTRGGKPEYKSIAEISSKPTLSQFVAKNGPLNPKMDQTGLEAKYKTLYPD